MWSPRRRGHARSCFMQLCPRFPFRRSGSVRTNDPTSTLADANLPPFNLWTKFLGRDSQRMPKIILLDTGSAVNVMSRRTACDLNLPQRRIPRRDLRPFNSNPEDEFYITVDTEVEVEWHRINGKQTYISRFLVADMSQYDILLGAEAIKQYGLLTVPSNQLAREGHHRSLEEPRKRRWFQRRPG